MKRILLLICLALPVPAAASEGAASLTCYQRRPYLELAMKWDEAGGFALSLAAPDGAEGLPLFYGAVTSYSLGYLRRQKEDLGGWPGYVSLRWAPGRCSKSAQDRWVVECGGPAQPAAGTQWPYATSTFMSYRQRQSGVDRDFDSRRMTWAVEAQGATYFLGFDFAADYCIGSGPVPRREP